MGARKPVPSLSACGGSDVIQETASKALIAPNEYGHLRPTLRPRLRIREFHHRLLWDSAIFWRWPSSDPALFVSLGDVILCMTTLVLSRDTTGVGGGGRRQGRRAAAFIADP